MENAYFALVAIATQYVIEIATNQAGYESACEAYASWGACYGVRVDANAFVAQSNGTVLKMENGKAVEAHGGKNAEYLTSCWEYNAPKFIKA